MNRLRNQKILNQTFFMFYSIHQNTNRYPIMTIAKLRNSIHYHGFRYIYCRLAYFYQRKINFFRYLFLDDSIQTKSILKYFALLFSYYEQLTLILCYLRLWHLKITHWLISRIDSFHKNDDFSKLFYLYKYLKTPIIPSRNRNNKRETNRNSRDFFSIAASDTHIS